MSDEEIKVVIGHHIITMNHIYTPEEWERTKTDENGNFLHELPKKENPQSKFYTPPSRWYIQQNKKGSVLKNE